MSKPLQELNAEIFRQQLHSKFKVLVPEQEPILLELMAVEEPPHAPGMELFALHFLGPFQPRLVQRTHSLEHEKLGNFEIFLTAIGAEPKEGTQYESIFHRFLDKQA
jgi:uncharacterized protein DUF6916